MDPITVAMSLAQFAPQVVRWISGSDAAGDAAAKVIDVAKAVTGADTGDRAVNALHANPAAVLAFRQALAAQEVELDRAYLADRADARDRDLRMGGAGQRNRRADLMVLLDVVGLISCIGVLVFFREKIPGEVVGILSTVAGLFGACLRDAHQFEFGSSRNNQVKDQTIMNLTR